MMIQLSELKTTVETWTQLKSRALSTMELAQLSLEENDVSIENSLIDDLSDLQRDLSKNEFLLILSGDYDNRNAIVAIHAGAGGTESQDWAQILMRM